MTGFWILIGVMIVVVAGVAGLLVGHVDRHFDPDDPEFKAEIERRKKEEERQKAWKDKLK